MNYFIIDKKLSNSYYGVLIKLFNKCNIAMYYINEDVLIDNDIISKDILKEVSKNDTIYILGCVFDSTQECDILNALYTITKDIVWIDNHKESINTIKKFNGKITSLIDPNKTMMDLICKYCTKIEKKNKFKESIKYIFEVFGPLIFILLIFAIIIIASKISSEYGLNILSIK